MKCVDTLQGYAEFVALVIIRYHTELPKALEQQSSSQDLHVEYSGLNFVRMITEARVGPGPMSKIKAETREKLIETTNSIKVNRVIYVDM